MRHIVDLMLGDDLLLTATGRIVQYHMAFNSPVQLRSRTKSPNHDIFRWSRSIAPLSTSFSIGPMQMGVYQAKLVAVDISVMNSGKASAV